MNKQKVIIIILLVILLNFAFMANVVLSEGTSSGTEPSAGGTGGGGLDNPLGGIDDPRILIGNIINAVLGIVGSIALLVFIYGGFLWLTSGGQENKVTQGKNLIMWAALGLAIIFLSYALVIFVLQAIQAPGV